MLFKRAISVVFLLLSFPVLAALQASNGRDVIILGQSPCSLPAVLAAVPVARQPAFFSGEAVLDGKKFKLCWVPLGPNVGIIYEDGDQGLIPVQAFTEKGV